MTREPRDAPQFYLTAPSPCPYLPGRQERKVFTHLIGRRAVALNGENVLLSPHCADHTPDWLDNAMRFFIAQFERFRRGEPLFNVVDKNLGY